MPVSLLLREARAAQNGDPKSLAVLIDADSTSARYAHAILEEIRKLGEADVGEHLRRLLGQPRLGSGRRDPVARDPAAPATQ